MAPQPHHHHQQQPPEQQQVRPLTPQEILHEQYLEKLELPTLEQIVAIAKVQESKEEALAEKYHAQDEKQSIREAEAAGKIQRTYRGHRERRQINGLSLNPSTRWIEAIKEAQYRNLTTPHPRRTSVDATQPDGSPGNHSEARQHWHRLSQIARHARGDESDLEEDLNLLPTDSNKPGNISQKTWERRRRQKEEWKGKMMDLTYFLEMVDLKHRYGSNLRAYHMEWKNADTHENFFYWLDYGEGRNLDLQMCSRERLDKERVRYLSREERMDYLVQIDNEGKLCWKRNGAKIDTSEEWRDSIHGIVPKGDATPIYEAEDLAAPEAEKERAENLLHHEASSDEEVDKEETEEESVQRYADSVTNTKGPRKILHVSPATILNSLMRKSVKKNTWIFVADISMNLYVGIKKSGVFQHSSFLHGSRISAAGLIKIQDGLIHSLSPLSGHYRPPASAFRHFIAHLRAHNVDLSHLSISKSYAILVGLESYVHTKEHFKHAVHRMERGAETVVRPEEARRKKEKELDGSESARREREVRERQGEEGLRGRMKKLGVSGMEKVRSKGGGVER